MKQANPEYLEKARQLGEEEQERLLSRMAGKLPRKLEKDKLTLLEAMAIQLEIEDEQLQEWRVRMHAIREKENKAAAKSRSAEKPAKADKPKRSAEDAAAVQTDQKKPALKVAKGSSRSKTPAKGAKTS